MDGRGRRGSGMFGRLLSRALRRRWRRLAVAALAVMQGAILVGALSNLTLDIGGKIGKELRNYGANVVIAPRDAAAGTASGGAASFVPSTERYLGDADLAILEERGTWSEITGYVPYLYGVVEVGGRQVILAGTWLDQVPTVSPWWQVTGDWLARGDARGAMVGVEAARGLGLGVGDPLVLRRQGNSVDLVVRGVVDTGAAEDNQVFVNLPVAQDLLGRGGAVGLVQVSVATARRPLEESVRALQRAMPAAQVKIIGQIADAEKNIFFRIQLLMALVAALVLLAAAVSVASTMTATVLERTREIGLLKALGANNSRIAGLFLAEAAAIGLGAGLVGYGVGLLMAQIIARSVFQAGIAVQWLGLPLTVGVALGVVLIASITPVRRAIAIDPAITLRGE